VNYENTIQFLIGVFLAVEFYIHCDKLTAFFTHPFRLVDVHFMVTVQHSGRVIRYSLYTLEIDVSN